MTWCSVAQTITQSVRVHERDDTPVEYIVTRQWFVRALDFKEQLIAAGERIAWHPEHMGDPLSDLGGELEMGLEHRTPALLRRAFSGLVLRCLWRDSASR